MTPDSPFPYRHDRYRFLYTYDLTVPDLPRLPLLIWESVERHCKANPTQREDGTAVLEAWVAASCFGWKMRNHLLDSLPKLKPLVDPEQWKSLHQLWDLCDEWNKAEVRSTRETLRPLDKYELSKRTRNELNAFAEDLERRGIGDPAEMRRLTGSRVRKDEVIEGLWTALNPPCPMAQAEPPSL
jgi:hypothetical protein